MAEAILNHGGRARQHLKATFFVACLFHASLILFKGLPAAISCLSGRLSFVYEMNKLSGFRVLAGGGLLIFGGDYDATFTS